MLNFYNFARRICLFFFKLYFKIEVIGIENLNKSSSGLVLISNHKSYLDPIFLGLFSKRRLFFMAKKELFRIPVFKNIIKKLGAFAVDRNKKDLKAIEKAVEIARSGKVVAMFPQGGRSKTIEKDRPKTGFLRISLLAECSVMPCSLFYKSYFPRSRVYIYFGEEIDISTILKKDGLGKDVNYKGVKRLTFSVWEEVLKLYKKQEEKNGI